MWTLPCHSLCSSFSCHASTFHTTWFAQTSYSWMAPICGDFTRCFMPPLCYLSWPTWVKMIVGQASFRALTLVLEWSCQSFSWTLWLQLLHSWHSHWPRLVCMQCGTRYRTPFCLHGCKHWFAFRSLDSQLFLSIGSPPTSRCCWTLNPWCPRSGGCCEEWAMVRCCWMKKCMCAKMQTAWSICWWHKAIFKASTLSGCWCRRKFVASKSFWSNPWLKSGSPKRRGPKPHLVCESRCVGLQTFGLEWIFGMFWCPVEKMGCCTCWCWGRTAKQGQRSQMPWRNVVCLWGIPVHSPLAPVIRVMEVIRVIASLQNHPTCRRNLAHHCCRTSPSWWIWPYVSGWVIAIHLQFTSVFCCFWPWSDRFTLANLHYTFWKNRDGNGKSTIYGRFSH